MLLYTEVGIGRLEVPGEISLCIYISGCQNNCRNCHYSDLKSTEYGVPLEDNISVLIGAYLSQVTCICFLGEGRNTSVERKEFASYAKLAKKFELKTCLYSGRDIFPENWMRIFDYVKVGSYRPALGDLFCRTTNQRLYLNQNGKFTDVTSNFWKQFN